MPKHFTLAAEVEKRREDAVEIEADGHTFVIDPPDLWPDDMQERMRDAALADDNVGVARCLLGSEEYDVWVEKGGTANLLLDIYRKAKGELGESSASSPS